MVPSSAANVAELYECDAYEHDMTAFISTRRKRGPINTAKKTAGSLMKQLAKNVLEGNNLKLIEPFPQCISLCKSTTTWWISRSFND